MAAVTYRIGGKYDNKGVKSAQKGLSSLSKSFKALKVVAVAAVAVKGLKAMSGQIQECTTAFNAQNKALQQLQLATQNSNKLTATSFKNLINFSGQLQKTTTFGDEAIEAQATYLANLGLTEDQIQKTITASADLASATGTDLASAVKLTSKTLSGTVGQLKYSVEGVADLTAEQLKNGDAVDLVAKKYKGYAEQLASTTLEGRELQNSNTIGDIKESLGQLSANLKFEALGKIQPILDKVSTWLSDNSDDITNFFLNLPEMVTISLGFIKEIIRTLFTIDFWKQYLTNIGEYAVKVGKAVWTSLKAIFALLATVLKESFETIANHTLYAFKVAGVGIKNFFIGIINTLSKKGTDAINTLLKGVQKIPILGENVKLIELKQIALDEKPVLEENTDAQDNINAALENVFLKVSDSTSDIVEASKDAWAGLSDTMKDQFGNSFDKFLSTTKTALDNKSTPKLSNTTDSGSDSGSGSGSSSDSGTGTDTGDLSETTTGTTSIISSLTTSLGQLGSVIKAIMSGNPIGIVVMAITELISQLSSKSQGFSDVLNVLSTVIGVVSDAILPMIDTIFTPLAAILKVIGNMLSVILVPVMDLVATILTPIINILTTVFAVLEPVFQLLGIFLDLFITMNPQIQLIVMALNVLSTAFTFLFNKVLVPLLNGALKMVSVIGNGFIGVYNAIVKVFKSIDIFGYKPFEGMNTKKAIDYDALKIDTIDTSSMDTGSGSTDTDSSTSGSASYTAASDIYINIYYSNSYVNGDAREIAINLRDEIKSAEALGY